MEKDFTSVSPSAWPLLLMKAETSIPYAREAVKWLDGKTVAVLFGYACHPTTLSFTKWCGDYPGFAQLALEKAHPGAAAMFVNTCGGDQNPLPRRMVELAKEYGKQLATAVDAAAQSGAAFTSWEPPLTHEMLDVMTLPIEFDTGKARHLLGFAPVVGYDEGVMRTLRGQWPTAARFGAES